MDKKTKALKFVEHIERHLKDPANIWKFPDDVKVMCKICGKTIDEIADEQQLRYDFQLRISMGTNRGRWYLQRLRELLR